MFECCLILLKDFCSIIPTFICIILIFNLIADMVLGGR